MCTHDGRKNVSIHRYTHNVQYASILHHATAQMSQEWSQLRCYTDARVTTSLAQRALRAARSCGTRTWGTSSPPCGKAWCAPPPAARSRSRGRPPASPRASPRSTSRTCCCAPRPECSREARRFVFLRRLRPVHILGIHIPRISESEFRRIPCGPRIPPLTINNLTESKTQQTN